MINKPLKSPENFIRPRWISISLKEKFSAFAAAVVLTTALSALLNLFMANFAFHGFGTILDDNAYVFCSHLRMSMAARAGVTGLAAHPCDYYEITADLDVEQE